MPTTVPASVTSLESLVAFLAAHRQEIRDESLDTTSLPNFGGAPVDEPGVYSWDATRLLVDANGTWEIVARVTDSEARAAADEKLGGVWLANKSYAYKADEVGQWVYGVPAADVVKLGRKLLAGDADAYGEWAQASGGDLIDNDADPRLDQIADAGGNVPDAARCQCGEVFGGKCDADPAPRSSLVPVRVVPASNVEEARKANSPQAYAHDVYVTADCHDAIEALEDSQFVDAECVLVIGMRA